MKSKTTQTSEVLNYLKTNEGITSWQAFQLFGVTRLAAIIFNLRKQGHNIETFLMDGVTRYNEPTRYAKYIYRGEK